MAHVAVVAAGDPEPRLVWSLAEAWPRSLLLLDGPAAPRPLEDHVVTSIAGSTLPPARDLVSVPGDVDALIWSGTIDARGRTEPLYALSPRSQLVSSQAWDRATAMAQSRASDHDLDVAAWCGPLDRLDRTAAPEHTDLLLILLPVHIALHTQIIAWLRSRHPFPPAVVVYGRSADDVAARLAWQTNVPAFAVAQLSGQGPGTARQAASQLASHAYRVRSGIEHQMPPSSDGWIPPARDVPRPSLPGLGMTARVESNQPKALGNTGRPAVPSQEQPNTGKHPRVGDRPNRTSDLASHRVPVSETSSASAPGCSTSPGNAGEPVQDTELDRHASSGTDEGENEDAADDDLVHVSILGPVTITGTRGRPLEPGRRRRGTELLVWIALNPGAASSTLDEAIWPRAAAREKTRNSLLSRLRGWLGKHASGDPFLPRNHDSNGYILQHTDLDWHQFNHLSRKNASLEDLDEALQLVRGRPLEGIDQPTWSLPWAIEIADAIVDTALRATSAHITRGDGHGARRSIAAGRRAEPASERLWQTWMHAEHATGTHQELRRVVDAYVAHQRELGLTPDPETLDYANRLLGREAD